MDQYGLASEDYQVQILLWSANHIKHFVLGGAWIFHNPFHHQEDSSPILIVDVSTLYPRLTLYSPPEGFSIHKKDSWSFFNEMEDMCKSYIYIFQCNPCIYLFQAMSSTMTRKLLIISLKKCDPPYWRLEWDWIQEMTKTRAMYFCIIESYQMPLCVISIHRNFVSRA